MRKKELFVIACALAAAIALWLFIRLSGRDTRTIRITVAGKEYGTYSLDKDQVVPIGDTNTCEIKNGEARMTAATCPDHLCMHQGPIGPHGGTIICLPNKVVIEGGSGGSAGEDSLTPDALT